METITRLRSAEDPEAMRAANQLAVVLRFQKRFDEALPIAQKTLERRVAVFGEVNSEVH